jgi:hypothetical protein
MAYCSGIQPGVRENILFFCHLKLIIWYIIFDVIYFIYFRCRLHNMYNLHYVPTTLGIKSWREIISGGKGKAVPLHAMEALGGEEV